jgi:hypothetical protein
VAISPNAESVTLAANCLHLLAPHVGRSSEEPQAELSRVTLDVAPAHDVRAGRVRDVVNPQLSKVERSVPVKSSSV